jgi:hypothetical protein
VKIGRGFGENWSMFCDRFVKKVGKIKAFCNSEGRKLCQGFGGFAERKSANLVKVSAHLRS